MGCVGENQKQKRLRKCWLMSDTIVKSSRHSFKNTNPGKLGVIRAFIKEYRRVAEAIVSDIWTNGYSYTIKDIEMRFAPKENRLEAPPFLDYNKFDIETTLTARALSSLVTQVSGILSAACEKQRKRIYIYEKNKEIGKTKLDQEKLIKKIKQNIPQKPNTNRLNPELSSKCCMYIETEESSFDGFLKFGALMKGISAVYIPINMHRHSGRLLTLGAERMNSFLITEDSVNVRWRIPLPERKTEGKIVGADQGIKNVITLSDGQAPEVDIHGHSLDSIIKRMSRKKKGSKSFKRSQEHRTNHINMLINQIDTSEILEIRLEQIYNIGYGKSNNRYLQHFTNTTIRDKMEDFATMNGVRFVEQDSTYRSQRCSCCGLVRKANRKRKIYECKHCGNVMDADLNAATNHAHDIPEVPYTLRMKNLNRGSGFFWTKDGFFDFSGRSLESLPPVEDK